VYGLGHSEIVVGRAIKGLGARPYVFTKCSLVWDNAGKISHNLQRAQSVAPIASLQPPYSLVATDVGTAILPYALSQQISVIVYSPMGSGLLTGA
jgi:aryl-alcohol dehydrogenase-like predicted oxidoreductase